MRHAITVTCDDNEDVVIVWATIQSIEEVGDNTVRIRTRLHEYFAPIQQLSRIPFTLVSDNDRSIHYPLHMIEAVKDYTAFLKDGEILQLGDKDREEWFQSVTR